MNEKEQLDFIINFASLIAEMFGSECEVTVSDLTNPDNAVIAIFNGHVSGREVGSPMTEDAKERVSNSADGLYINYRKSGSSKKTKYIKSSTITTKIGEKDIAVCINYDCTGMLNLDFKLKQFLAVANPDGASDVNYTSNDIIASTIHDLIKDQNKPVHLLNKKERLQIIAGLNEKGLLKMQKSTTEIATILGISRYTVYNYINELGIQND
ncbi:MAG: PAS domain-containing protein [Clostridiaceae bacterium]